MQHIRNYIFYVLWHIDPLLGSGQRGNGLAGKGCFLRGSRRWVHTQQWV
jgi:hypothetical protein